MSRSDDLRSRKRALRSEVRARRDALSPKEREARSEAVARNLFALPAMEGASTVMLFSSFGAEVDTGPIVERLAGEGRRVALPRIAGRTIDAVTYRPGEPVRGTSFGAMEPADGEIVPPEEIDVVVIPGLAFDRRGFRVGYGGGFYDRFLRRVRTDVATVGICFAVQVVEEVPHGRGDRRVALVVTDEGLIWCR